MRNLIVISGFLFIGMAMANPLAMEVTGLQQNLDARSKIINLYNKELQKEGSPLNLAIKQIEVQEDFPELGALSELQKKDLFLTSSGRGSMQSAHQQYLLGVHASRKGSGLIEEHVAYIQASIELNLENETETVTLEKFVVISDKTEK